MSGRNSGGDINDMAVSGTSVPEDAAAPRHIKSVPAPGQAADASDPNQLGSTDLAGAATNAQDIPRVSHVSRRCFCWLTAVDQPRYSRI